MKTLPKKTILILTFFVLLFGFSSCNDEFLEPKVPKSISGSENLKTPGDITSIQFDPALFATKIENRLDGQVPGYAYCIIKNGQVVAQKGKGDARYSVDSPSRLYSGNEIQDIASTTKYVTALLTMKLLDRTGLPINIALERKVYL